MRRLILTACLLLLALPPVTARADTGIKVTCDTLWVRVFAGQETTLAGVRLCGDSWAVPPKWWVMYYADSVAGGGGAGTTDSTFLSWGLKTSASDSWLRPDSVVWVDSTTLDLRYLRAGDSTTTDTLAFHHNSLADTAETLNARVVNIDTVAGPAALNVAGNAWVRDTTTTDFLFVNAISDDSTVPAGGFSLGVNNARPAYWSFLWGDGSMAGNFGDVVMGYACSTKLNVLEGDYSVVMGHFSQASAGYSIVLGNGNNATDSAPSSTIVGGVSNSTHNGYAAIFGSTNGVVLARNGILIGGASDTVPAADSNKIHLGFPAIIDDSARAPTFEATGAAGFVGVGAVVPGQIIDWYGDSSAFPTGYVLCDGTRKFKDAAGDSVTTPDLRNFFTVGASIDTGNGIPMSTIEDTTGTTAKATGGSQKYTPAGTNSGVQPATHGTTAVSEGELDPVNVVDESNANHNSIAPDFTGTRAVLVQPYVAVWKLVRSRTW